MPGHRLYPAGPTHRFGIVPEGLERLHSDEDDELSEQHQQLTALLHQVRGQEVNQTRTEERGARLRDIRAQVPGAAAGHADHRPERERQAVGGDAPAERSGARWCVLRDKASQRPARQGHQGEEFRGAQRDGHLRECPKTLEVMRLRGERSEADDLELLERNQEGITISEVNRLIAYERHNREVLNKAVATPALPEHWRELFVERLRRLANRE